MEPIPFDPQNELPATGDKAASAAHAANEAPEDESPPTGGNKHLTAELLKSCLLTGHELARMEIPRRPRLMGDWLCKGDLGFIFAPRGVGKTWLSMALPHAIAAAKALGLWNAGESPASVCYIDGEMPLELSKARHCSLAHEDGKVTYLHHEILFQNLGRTLNIADPVQQRAITQMLLDAGHDFLILDNLSCLASGLDENKGIEYEVVKLWLLELRRRGITVIVVHHAGRNGMMRGHSKREDDASWIIELRDAKADGEAGARFTSHFAKPSRNTGDYQPPLLWHFITDEKTGRTSIHCELAENSEYDQFIKHVVDGVESVRDIANMMGKNPGTISKWAKKAHGEGRIKKTKSALLPP
jgi:hypothetical protein